MTVLCASHVIRLPTSRPPSMKDHHHYHHHSVKNRKVRTSVQLKSVRAARITFRLIVKELEPCMHQPKRTRHRVAAWHSMESVCVPWANPVWVQPVRGPWFLLQRTTKTLLLLKQKEIEYESLLNCESPISCPLQGLPRPRLFISRRYASFQSRSQSHCTCKPNDASSSTKH